MSLRSPGKKPKFSPASTAGLVNIILFTVFVTYGCQTTSTTSTLSSTNRIQNNTVALSAANLNQTLDVNIIEFNPGIILRELRVNSVRTGRTVLLSFVTINK